VRVSPARDHGAREVWPLDRAELRGESQEELGSDLSAVLKVLDEVHRLSGVDIVIEDR
jgi:hypothetical protein